MPKITDPIMVGKMKVKNRIWSLPMVQNFADGKGYPTRQMIETYRRRAKGGYGLVHVEATFMRWDGKCFFGMLGVYEDHMIPYHNELTDAIHEAGARCSLQIMHGGKQSNTWITGMQPVAPSSKNPWAESIPRALTTAECEQLIVQFGEAAARAKYCGYDAIMLHAAHGFILNEFMSPYSNDRRDRFGDPTVFITEVIKKCKQLCGADYPVLIRLDVNEAVPGGIDLELNKRLIPAVTQAGVDGIEATNSNFDSLEYNLEPIYWTPGGRVEQLAAIKEFTHVPVGVRGRINDPRLAMKVIEDGKGDWVGLGRQPLADPFFPLKMFEGRYDDVRKCICCDAGCSQRLFDQLRIKCSINYSYGKEHLEPYGVVPAKVSRKVVVVGGGPGGMECARVLAQRGHKVTLYEKKGELGGMVNVAAATPRLNTGDLIHIVEWLPRELKKRGVEVKLNKEITVKDIDAMKPDAVVIATGSHLTVPHIPGATGANVVSLEDYHLEKKPIGNTVVVLGGQEGAEAAISLGREGKKVTLVSETATYTDAIYNYVIRQKVLAQYLNEAGVKVITEAKINKITSLGVVIADKAGKEQTLHADTVVLGVGRTAERHLADALQGRLNVYEIGDCVSPRRIQEAIHEANAVARLID